MPVTGGDDLDDGLELDDSFMAGPSSSAGSVIEDEAGELEVNNQADVLADESEEVDENEGDIADSQEAHGKQSSAAGGTKRKAEENQDDDAVLKAERKRRRKEKEKERKAKRRKEVEVPIHKPLSQVAVAEVSRMLLTCLRETFPAASPMEIDDMSIPDESVLAPSGQATSDSQRNDARLLETLRNLLTTNKKPPVATPQIVILCLSGQRSADVCRIVKPVKGAGEVAKLFAKHFKIEDQIKHLAKSRVSIAVGTPGRVAKILAMGGFKVTPKTIFLLDASYHDSKQRTLLSLPEARMDLWKGLFGGDSRTAILGGGARIGLV